MKIYEHKIDDDILKNVFKLLENSKKPLIIAGAGAVWSHASDTLLKFAEKSQYSRSNHLSRDAALFQKKIISLLE